MKFMGIINAILKRNSLILNLIIIILVNIAGITLYYRLDLTRNSAYSLSEISKKLVSTLEDPLNIKVFFSKDLPAPYNSVYRYLRDLLEEYSQFGNKNFNYEFVDVENEKEIADDFGIFPVQVREIQDDQLKFRNAYMGLSIIHGDLIEKIESITESKGLEYKITTLIKKMTGKIDSLLKLDSPIKVTLYASSNLPIGGMDNLSNKVADIVKKSNVKNYNKLKFSYIDPYAENSDLGIADIYGIAKLEWPAFKTIDGNRVKADKGIIGIVIELEDRFESIQLLSRSIFGRYNIGGLDKLEDRINSAIDNLVNINPKIGYITGHDERPLTKTREQNDASNLNTLLSDMYELNTIDTTKDEIPEDINALIINGPKNKFSDYELLMIDQFIMKGKSVLFLIDSFQEIRNQQNNMFGGGRPVVLPINTGIENLISHYGIIVKKDIVLDEKCFRTTQRGIGGQDIYFVPIINEAGLDRENEITSTLKMIVFPKVSSLDIVEDKIKNLNIKKTILVTSSEKSWLMQGRINFMPFGMSPPEESKMSRFNLAVLLRGEYVSYFKDRTLPQRENQDKKNGGKAPKTMTPITTAKIIEKSVKPGSIIVVGTSEITSSGVIDRDGNSLNSIFMHNMIDYITGNYDIPDMRSKGLEFNPLEDTSESTRMILKLFNIAGLPVIVVCIGLFIWRRTINRKKKIMEEFSNYEK